MKTLTLHEMNNVSGGLAGSTVVLAGAAVGAVLGAASFATRIGMVEESMGASNGASTIGLSIMLDGMALAATASIGAIAGALDGIGYGVVAAFAGKQMGYVDSWF